MTALQILSALKADPLNAVLWLNHDRRVAAFHAGGSVSHCQPVAYEDAMIARTDPALSIVSQADGETLAA